MGAAWERHAMCASAFKGPYIAPRSVLKASFSTRLSDDSTSHPKTFNSVNLSIVQWSKIEVLKTGVRTGDKWDHLVRWACFPLVAG